jgi:hypothetical protein
VFILAVFLISEIGKRSGSGIEITPADEQIDIGKAF